MNFTSSTPYHALPPHIQQMIDQTYNIMHQHHHTMSSLETMAPFMLQSSSNNNTSDADKAAGHLPLEPTNSLANAPLLLECSKARAKLKHLTKSIQQSIQDSQHILERSVDVYKQTFQYIAWPTEACAAKHGIILPLLPENIATGTSNSQVTNGTSLNQQGQNQTPSTFKEIQQKLNSVLASQASQVDRTEKVPSPYFWITLSQLQEQGNMVHERLQTFQTEIRLLSKSLSEDRGEDRLLEQQQMMYNGGMRHNVRVGTLSNGNNVAEDLSVALKNQIDAFVRVASMISHVHEELERWKDVYKRKIMAQKMRQQPNRPTVGGNSVDGVGVGIGIAAVDYLKRDNGFDPFLEADRKDAEQEQKLNEEVRRIVVEESIRSSSVQHNNPNNPAATGTVTPAPSLFASTAGNNTSGNLFSSTPATATNPTSGGGIFGTPNPAPATGGSLFSAPAPAPVGTGGLFGASSTPTPAPATTGGLFGSSSTPAAPAAGGGLFGSTAPAPGAPGTPGTPGIFGSTPAPVPAGAGLFGGGAGFGGVNTSAPSTASTRKGRKPGRRR